MLMFVYGLDADAAFDALRSQSQEHNVKLVLIAEQVVKDLVDLAKNKGPRAGSRSTAWCTAPTNASPTLPPASSAAVRRRPIRTTGLDRQRHRSHSTRKRNGAVTNSVCSVRIVETLAHRCHTRQIAGRHQQKVSWTTRDQ